MLAFGFFAMGKQPRAVEETPQRYHEPSNPAAVETALGEARRQFGKRRSPPTPVASFAQAQEAMHILDTRSFDWYFAHHGFEGNRKLAHGQLIAMGETARAGILAEVGRLHDDYMRDVFVDADGEPSEEQERAYLECMSRLDK